MSRRRSVSAELAHMRAEVRGKTNEQIEEMYGIQINENGSVFDATENKRFPNLIEWMRDYVTTAIEDEEDEDDHRNGYDDDEY